MYADEVCVNTCTSVWKKGNQIVSICLPVYPSMKGCFLYGSVTNVVSVSNVVKKNCARSNQCETE